MVTLAAIIGVSALGGSRELSQRALAERQRLAEAVADHLDYILKSNLSMLQGVALNVRDDSASVESKSVRAALREAYLRSIFTEGVFLLDGTGKLVGMEPPQAGHTDDFAALAPVHAALTAGRPEVSSLVSEGKNKIYAAVPVRDWRGEVVGAVGGELEVDAARFRSLLPPLRMGETTYLDLVDGNGIVLASTKPGRAFSESDHGRFLADAIQAKRSVVGACHSCHEKSVVPEREVMAFVPLKFAPWGVSIRQAEREALGAAFAMQRRLVAVGTVTILVALLFAWGVARSVTKPLGVLRRAAQRIQSGSLDDPIPPLGEDEIGELARSFDQMRMSLRESAEAVAQGQRDLERRVEERTRALNVLNRELQQKEQLRRELLKKVITAQEEERRRIARELHDETSQASAALLVFIETTATTVADPGRAALQRMKTITARILDGVHRLIFDLRPSALDDLGHPSALRSSAESHLEHLGIDLTFEVLGNERRLKPEIETTLFRIGQEAIANICRHAEAESVNITIEFGDAAVALHIEDDGNGFDLEECSRCSEGGRGLGLLGMKERAALVGGELTIHSAPGRGTRISVTVPAEPV